MLVPNNDPQRDQDSILDNLIACARRLCQIDSTLWAEQAVLIRARDLAADIQTIRDSNSYPDSWVTVINQLLESLAQVIETGELIPLVTRAETVFAEQDRPARSDAISALDAYMRDHPNVASTMLARARLAVDNLSRLGRAYTLA